MKRVNLERKTVGALITTRYLEIAAPLKLVEPYDGQRYDGISAVLGKRLR